MKRFTIRTLALALLLVLLMAGIAVAITGGNGIFSFLERDAAIPGDAKDALQTEFTQEGGELTNVTFRVRDAISDGRTLFVAIEGKTKNKEDVLLTMMDYVPAGDAKAMADWKSMMATRGSVPDLESITPEQNVHYVYYSFAARILQDGTEVEQFPLFGTDVLYEDMNTIVYNLMIDLRKLDNPTGEITLELSNSEL